MIRMFKAELLKLRRRRVAIAVALTTLAFAVVASVAVFLSATDAGAPGASAARPSQSLGQAGGATEAFSIGASFAGILVFVLFIANVAGEFSQGTFRTLLMRQPRRIALLAGKMTALLAFAALVLLVAEILTVVASVAIAPTQDVSTASWFGLDGLGEAAARLRERAVRRVGVGVPRHGARDLRALDPRRAGDRDRVVGAVRAPARGRLGGGGPVVPRPAARVARRGRDRRRLADAGARARRRLRGVRGDGRRDGVRAARHHRLTCVRSPGAGPRGRAPAQAGA